MAKELDAVLVLSLGLLTAIALIVLIINTVTVPTEAMAT